MMCAWAAPTSRHGAGGLTGSFGQKGLFFSISVGNRKKKLWEPDQLPGKLE